MLLGLGLANISFYWVGWNFRYAVAYMAHPLGPPLPNRHVTLAPSISDFIFWETSPTNRSTCVIQSNLFWNKFFYFRTIQKFCSEKNISEQKIVIGPCVIVWLLIARATSNICATAYLRCKPATSASGRRSSSPREGEGPNSDQRKGEWESQIWFWKN